MALADRQKEFVGHLMAGAPHLNIAGLPLVSACAETGNATAENLVRPTTTGVKDHGSDGTMQWRLGRLDDLKSWASGHSLAWDTLQAQAWFLIYETQRDYAPLYADLIAGTKSIETLTANIEKFFERPATLADVDTRIKYAKNTLALMSGDSLPHPEIPVPVLTGTISISAVETSFQAAMNNYKSGIIALDKAKQELMVETEALSQVAVFLAEQLKTSKELTK